MLKRLIYTMLSCLQQGWQHYESPLILFTPIDKLAVCW